MLPRYRPTVSHRGALDGCFSPLEKADCRVGYLRSPGLVRLSVFMLPLVAMACALGLTDAATATARSAPKAFVTSPKAGQSVKGDQVRIVVRAGPEHEDLKAWL